MSTKKLVTIPAIGIHEEPKPTILQSNVVLQGIVGDDTPPVKDVLTHAHHVTSSVFSDGYDRHVLNNIVTVICPESLPYNGLLSFKENIHALLMDSWIDPTFELPLDGFDILSILSDRTYTGFNYKVSINFTDTAPGVGDMDFWIYMPDNLPDLSTVYPPNVKMLLNGVLTDTTDRVNVDTGVVTSDLPQLSYGYSLKPDGVSMNTNSKELIQNGRDVVISGVVLEEVSNSLTQHLIPTYLTEEGFITGAGNIYFILPTLRELINVMSIRFKCLALPAAGKGVGLISDTGNSIGWTLNYVTVAPNVTMLAVNCHTYRSDEVIYFDVEINVNDDIHAVWDFTDLVNKSYIIVNGVLHKGVVKTIGDVKRIYQMLVNRKLRMFSTWYYGGGTNVNSLALIKGYDIA